MAYWLVRAIPNGDLNELQTQLDRRAFDDVKPFGEALSAGLRGARVEPDGTAIWEEEDYCVPPLAQERAFILDRYFRDIRVEDVGEGNGWKQIQHLPKLFER